MVAEGLGWDPVQIPISKLSQLEIAQLLGVLILFSKLVAVSVTLRGVSSNQG